MKLDLLDTSDKIKQKVIEKIKEFRSTKENSKSETYLDGLTITSKFRNGDVTAKFSLSIFSEMELDKSELRNILLNQLI